MQHERLVTIMPIAVHACVCRLDLELADLESDGTK